MNLLQKLIKINRVNLKKLNILYKMNQIVYLIYKRKEKGKN